MIILDLTLKGSILFIQTHGAIKPYQKLLSLGIMEIDVCSYNDVCNFRFQGIIVFCERFVSILWNIIVIFSFINLAIIFHDVLVYPLNYEKVFFFLIDTNFKPLFALLIIKKASYTTKKNFLLVLFFSFFLFIILNLYN